MDVRNLALPMVMVLTTAALADGSNGHDSTHPSEAADGEMELPHLKVDPSAGRVVVSAEVCLRSGPLELLLCEAGTKEYESILSTEAEASHLHAALLVLGLSPGLPGEWVDTDADGRFLPPRGPELEVTLRWRDRAGELRESEASDWLRPDNGADLPRRWVFVGSELLPDGRYWADVDGDVVSVSNFPSAVIDVPFRSTTDNELLLFEANSERIPPVGTEVEVIIEPAEGAEKAQYARALLEIDRSGRLRVDGESVDPEGLTDWAETFTMRHPKARVVIRPDPRALMWDVTRARSQLRLGGIRDFDLRYLRVEEPVLPRTQDQARRALEQWREKFDNPGQFIREPAVEAERQLRGVVREIDRLETRRELLRQYSRDLKEALEQYRSSREPTEQDGEVPRQER